MAVMEALNAMISIFAASCSSFRKAEKSSWVEIYSSFNATFIPPKEMRPDEGIIDQHQALLFSWGPGAPLDFHEHNRKNVT